MHEQAGVKPAWRSWSGLPQLIAHQAAWWTCVLEMGWTGPLTMAAFIVLHLALLRDSAADELRLVVRSMVIGVVLDSSLAWGGAVSYEGGPLVWLSPLWLVAIWAGFGATLRHSQSLFVRTRWHAAATGAIGGPLAYIGGGKLGALTVHGALGYVAVGALWLAAMLALEVSVRQVSGGSDEVLPSRS